MNRHYWCIIEISQDRRKKTFFFKLVEAGTWQHAERLMGQRNERKGLIVVLMMVLVMKVIWDILFLIPDIDKWWYLWFDHNDNDEEYVLWGHKDDDE